VEVNSLSDASVWRLDTFLVPPGFLEGRAVALEGPERHHAFDVARTREGDVVRLIDGDGTEALARVDGVCRERATLTVLESRVHSRDAAVLLTIVQGLPKARGMDEVVRRCAELGVAEVIPATTERTLARKWARPDRERLARWRSISLAATKQSRGVFITDVAPVAELVDVVDRVARAERAVVAWEDETGVSLSDALSLPHRPRRVIAVVGPEGGLTGGEVEMLASAGARPVGLGRRILRADWAAAALSAMVAGELGGLLP
jgi:16S rRNA (uracil1498-N3)-methyltransferase